MKWINQFSRITTPGKKFLPQIDGLRFIAIMAVIAYHVRSLGLFHLGIAEDSPLANHGAVNQVFISGHLGVQLFFAISGFILGLPFAQHYMRQAPAVDLRKYYLRRVTRLEPPYLINLAFSLFLCCALFRFLPSHPHLYHRSDWATYAGKHFAASLIYGNGLIFNDFPYPNLVLWSLEVEVQFYILAPLFALLFKIAQPLVRRSIMIGLIVVDCVICNFFFGHLIFTSLLGNYQFFLVGFLICDFYLVFWTGAEQTYIWDALFLSVIGAIICFQQEPYFVFALPWLILVCLGSAFKGVLSRAFLSLPWVATIGGMCYTIYMYHWFMISLLYRVTIHLQTHHYALDLLIQFAVISATIIPVCAVLFVFLERPFMQMDWPAKFWNVLKAKRRFFQN